MKIKRWNIIVEATKEELCTDFGIELYAWDQDDVLARIQSFIFSGHMTLSLWNGTWEHCLDALQKKAAQPQSEAWWCERYVVGMCFTIRDWWPGQAWAHIDAAGQS